MNTKNKTAGEALAEATKRNGTNRMPVLFKKRSILSGISHTMTLMIDPVDYQSWRNGKLIQEAMPYLTIEEREFLMSGMSLDEQREFFTDD